MNVTFTEAISLFFKRYVDFNGRSTRAEYWWAMLFYFLVGMALNIFSAIFRVGATSAISYNPAAAVSSMILSSVPNLLFSLAVIIPNIAITIRRLHDINRSGWWLLAWYGIQIFCTILVFVGLALTFHTIFHPETGYIVLTVIGALGIIGVGVWQLVWLCTASKPDNEYGPNPYGEQDYYYNGY